MKILYFILFLSIITIQVAARTKDNVEEPIKDSDNIFSTWGISWPNIDMDSIKQKVGKTMDGAKEVFGATKNVVKENVKNLVENFDVQEKIEYVQKTAKPYTENVKNLVENFNVQEKIEFVQKTAKPYTENMMGKTMDTFNSVKDAAKKTLNKEKLQSTWTSFTAGNWTIKDYLPLDTVKRAIEKIMVKLSGLKQCVESNVERNDVEMVLDLILTFVPGSDVVRQGGRIVMNLAQNKEDITDFVARVAKLIADGETKKAAHEIYGLGKKVTESGGFVKKMYNMLRK